MLRQYDDRCIILQLVQTNFIHFTMCIVNSHLPSSRARVVHNPITRPMVHCYSKLMLPCATPPSALRGTFMSALGAYYPSPLPPSSSYTHLYRMPEEALSDPRGRSGKLLLTTEKPHYHMANRLHQQIRAPVRGRLRPIGERPRLLGAQPRLIGRRICVYEGITQVCCARLIWNWSD